MSDLASDTVMLMAAGLGKRITRFQREDPGMGQKERRAVAVSAFGRHVGCRQVGARDRRSVTLGLGGKQVCLGGAHRSGLSRSLMPMLAAQDAPG